MKVGVIMKKINYANIEVSKMDPIYKITKDEYDNYLNEYMSSNDEVITMINPDLLALFMSIIGSKKTYEEDIEKQNVKSIGARK